MKKELQPKAFQKHCNQKKKSSETDSRSEVAARFLVSQQSNAIKIKQGFFFLILLSGRRTICMDVLSVYFV